MDSRLRQATQRAGRAADSVTLVAASKAQSVDRIRALAAVGQRCFGENYVQEARLKMGACAHLDLEWHFIGAVQSNKAAEVAACFDWVHTVASRHVAERLSRARGANRPRLNVCLQVNVDGEASKAGVAPDDAGDLAQAVADLPGLQLRGLMTLPAPTDDIDAQRRPFRALRELLHRLRELGLPLDTLSMGMSGDLEAAVAEGATLVRVGTALFGSRPGRS